MLVRKIALTAILLIGLGLFAVPLATAQAVTNHGHLHDNPGERYVRQGDSARRVRR
ncbi:MAG: hypothetical protein WAW17_17175 [Rhodococcus sp. (in: high G+C Gram-positive bacteria)]|uniref:hypothetical protein n=1 Tax=Rhodococcus sp. TaxID=1831 RepID=UPI003BB03938